MLSRSLSRRSVLVGLVAASPTVGCYGSFNLTKMLYNWNGKFSSMVIKELVFLGLVIIPVYGIFLFVDAFILNIIEFITGKHPVSAQALPDGQKMVMKKVPNAPNLISVEVSKDGVIQRSFYLRHIGDNKVELLDENTKPLAAAELNNSEEMIVSNGKGVPVLQLDKQQVDELAMRAEKSPISELVSEIVAHSENERLALLRP